jgi:hypothetical protein
MYPSPFERKSIRNWEEKGYFTPQIDPGQAPYSISDSAAQHNRTAAYGAFAQQYHTGYYYPA